jgi:predicted dehydrogenase
LAVRNAISRHGRVSQIGTQVHAGSNYRRVVEWVRSGKLGQIGTVRTFNVMNQGPGGIGHGSTAAPEGLDWNMWLGPAPEVPFDPFRCIYNFRWFWSTSGGQMTNWGAHHLDIARMVLDEQGPAVVSGLGGRYAIRDGGETPDVQEVLYDFPDANLGGKGCVVTWSAREINRGRGQPLEFHGTKGTLAVDRRGLRITPETTEGAGQDGRKPLMQPLDEQPAPDLDGLHVRNFLDCVKSRAVPVADVEEGHRSAVVCHLGNIATRLRRSLRWDPQGEQVVGDPEASALLHYEYRRPWILQA